jgi:hypothetical protein
MGYAYGGISESEMRSIVTYARRGDRQQMGDRAVRQTR